MDIRYPSAIGSGPVMRLTALCVSAWLLISAQFAFAETGQEAMPHVTQTDEMAADEPGEPKTMSGISILGNEEAPKSLVIVPWKSSELGDDVSLSDTLDDRAQPVDKEVFLRELSFYSIRSGK